MPSVADDMSAVLSEARVVWVRCRESANVPYELSPGLPWMATCFSYATRSRRAEREKEEMRKKEATVLRQPMLRDVIDSMSFIDVY